MKISARVFLAGLVCAAAVSALPTLGEVNVTQHHNHLSRDGLYIDPAFTPSAAAGLTRDPAFNGSINGHVYAQPLYIEGGPGGAALVLAVTESNFVYALDAATGAPVWQRYLGTPVPTSQQPCGNINPLGIAGTPVVDLPSRALLFELATTPDNGVTTKHLLYSLNVDTGVTNPGWPVDVGATALFGTTAFGATTQHARGALTVLNGIVYVPYGGHAGDCGTYFGWVIGVPLGNPSSVTAWATTARGGGAWAVGGLASDGTNIFVATGNTFNTSTWQGGEAIIRLQPGPSFSGATADFWAPTNWLALDNSDTDIGGSGPLLVDVPGATPSQLIVALGKDGNAYLLNRSSLGGIAAPLTRANVSGSPIIQAAATYRTAQGTYIVFDHGTTLTSFRITSTSPPAIATAWSVSQGGAGSPFVTSTDGTNNVLVWGLGAEGDQRLHAFSGDTGAVVYSGGGAAELMSGTRHMCTAIAARGRIYVATDNKVYAFTVPVSPISLTDLSMPPGGDFQFTFTNAPGMSFTAFAAADLSTPFTNWTRLGPVPEISPGHFQFTDLEARPAQRFYRVRSP